ncbi:BamA/TamA family outer membrane protein [aff. Roholtiella sp. LEGE 12411]|uniref:BamA/TamA family outer membrane protein n=1 Tax=aff. Roholtiella sp. LEGE 12411 TaxID=1828822 RepID=UPI00187F05AC|nr:BamA/TamA family outer membrane protein [aff. Roholtiella sp. LEGE 12411]MBE9038030.1 BamA/TamA family outer membrane protein [aff. Roholtiella sp. LEGE 12411]
MRLSPVLVAAVAIAAPLGGSLSANAQTADSLKQTTEVSTLETNQQLEKESDRVHSIEKLKSRLQAKGVSKIHSLQYPSVKALTVNSASLATSEVIVPTATTPIIAQTPQINPNPTQQPSPTPEISPPATQQQTPSSTPNSTPNLENVNPSATPVVPTTPGNTQQPSPTPEISPPATQQQTPFLTPGITPGQENFDPPAATPVVPTTPGNTQQPSSTPEIPSPGTQQQAPFSTPSTTPNQQNVNPPTFPTTPGNTQQPSAAPEAIEPRVLVSEVAIRSQTGQLSPELETQVYRVIRTQPGRTTTRSQLQEDINAIFGTGFFSNVQATPEDTPLGVRVSFIVQPNPVLTKVQVQANPGTGVASVIPANTVDEIFREQYGRILNLRDLQEGIKQLTKRYQDQGYVLANVIGAPQVAQNGVVTLQVAEGVVENIRVRFRNKEGQETDEKGQPIRGRTQEYIITREVELKPGQVFNRNTVQKDLQRIYGLGLFEDVNVSLDPGTDPSKVNVIVNVAERSSGSIAAGAGISSASGLFGTVSYQQQNLNGRNQKLGAELQVGQRELLFDLRFTDPWIAGDPYRTSYTANIFRRSSISLIFDGQDNDIRTLGNQESDGTFDDRDRPRVLRLGGGITFTRPLSANPYQASEWTASAGLQYQRVSTRDADGDLKKEGAVFNDDGTLRPGTTVPLSFSGEGEDDLLLVQLGAQRDRRNNPLQPTSGSYLRFGVDQSVPIGLGSIFLTRLRGSYSQYLPVSFTNFTKGPQTLAFNLQAGTILGDLPPYEAFTLGGSNSVRGYEEGALGSGRTYVQASVEYRFPVFSVVSGALFFDLGTDLGTSTRTAEVLNKNGSGYGYGLGVRVQSPLGPIRIDYGINDDGDSRINFGIGERF